LVLFCFFADPFKLLQPFCDLKVLLDLSDFSYFRTFALIWLFSDCRDLGLNTVVTRADELESARPNGLRSDSLMFLFFCPIITDYCRFYLSYFFDGSLITSRFSLLEFHSFAILSSQTAAGFLLFSTSRARSMAPIV